MADKDDYQNIDIKEGDPVTHTRSGREGNVLKVTHEVVTVGFDDGLDPEYQNYWPSELKKTAAIEGIPVTLQSGMEGTVRNINDDGTVDVQIDPAAGGGEGLEVNLQGGALRTYNKKAEKMAEELQSELGEPKTAAIDVNEEGDFDQLKVKFDGTTLDYRSYTESKAEGYNFSMELQADQFVETRDETSFPVPGSQVLWLHANGYDSWTDEAEAQIKVQQGRIAADKMEAGIQAMMAEEREYLELEEENGDQGSEPGDGDATASKTADGSGGMSGIRNTENLPEEVVRQVTRQLEEEAQHDTLDLETESELMELLEEQKEHPEENHIRTYSKTAALESVKDILSRDKYADPETGVHEKGELLSVSGPGDGGADSRVRVKPVEGGFEVVEVDGSPKTGYNDFHDFQVGDVLTEEQLAEAAEAYINWQSNPTTATSTNEMPTDDNTESFRSPNMREPWEAKNGESNGDDIEGDGDGNEIDVNFQMEDSIMMLPDKLEAEIDPDAGASTEGGGFNPSNIAASKEAAVELPFDVFGDNQEYGQGDYHIGGIVSENLVEARTRMVTRPGKLMQAAQTTLGKLRRGLKGLHLQSVSAMSIKVAKIHDDNGEIIAGTVRWNMILSAMKYRRRRAYSLVVPVLAGKMAEELAYFISAGGQKVAVTSDAVLDHMRLSGRKTHTDKGRAKAEIALRPE